MGNEYNRFNHHHHQYHQRSTFLPMLCSRPSITDVRLPTNPLKGEDPLSPKISCIGQVKRTNKVNGFPTSHHRLTFTTTTTTTTSPTNHHHKYSKLKKLFSSKNLTSTISTVSIATSTISTTSTRCKRQVIVNAAIGGPRIHGHKTHSYKIHHNNEDHQDHCVADINLVDLDPPLPVVKRVQAQAQAQDEEVKSLWKRRSGGVALEGLQLKQIHLPQHQNQPTTV